MGAMIALKRVRIHEEASEETTCFEADLYVEGGKAGTACNSGKGGCSVVYLLDKRYQCLYLQKFEAPCPCGHTKPGCRVCKGKGTVLLPLEEYVDHLVATSALDKEIASLKKKGCSAIIITEYQVHGLKTALKTEEAVRLYVSGRIKDPIKEVRFV